MAEAKPFAPAKLVTGLISSADAVFEHTEKALVTLYGQVDIKSPVFAFNVTDYYEKQMGKNLRRVFLSFARLVAPEDLSVIKVRTNALEEEIRTAFRGSLRLINIDPGILTRTALITATAKDFAHRIPLSRGIYAHLELLFKKNDIRWLEWTYPDFKQAGYRQFFLAVRQVYLNQLREARDTGAAKDKTIED